MKPQFLTAFVYLASTAVAAPPAERDAASLAHIDAPLAPFSGLEKRKGGGGGGGGRGGSSGSSSGSSSGGSRGSSGSSSGSSGGSTRTYTGTQPAYGGRYAGGGTSPINAGSPSRARNISPYLLPIAAVSFFPALWLYPVFAYNYPNSYRWNDNGRDRECNATCLCQERSPCGCDPDDDDFLRMVVTNNSTDPNAPPVNSSTVRTITYPNGTCISYINGTLADGSTATDISAASRTAAEYAGYWAMIATVVGTTLLL